MGEVGGGDSFWLTLAHPRRSLLAGSRFSIGIVVLQILSSSVKCLFKIMIGSGPLETIGLIYLHTMNAIRGDIDTRCLHRQYFVCVIQGCVIFSSL